MDQPKKEITYKKAAYKEKNEDAYKEKRILGRPWQRTHIFNSYLSIWQIMMYIVIGNLLLQVALIPGQIKVHEPP